MDQSPKSYPRKDAYNHTHKPAFQQASRGKEEKNITNMSGSSITELSYSSPSIRNSQQEIIILNERIEFLQRQLEMVTALLMEQQSNKQIMNNLENQNEELKENLIKYEKMNDTLEQQLEISEKNNQELASHLESANNEIQILKKELQSQSKRLNESKTSMKSNQQVQQDIIKVNQQIQEYIQKLNAQNDYDYIKQRNEILEREKIEMVGRISSLEQKLAQTLKSLEQYKEAAEDAKQSMNILKEEINQLNQISIQKQKQMQDEFYLREKKLQDELQHVKSLGLEESIRVPSIREVPLYEQTNSLVEIKNAKIRALEINNQYLKGEIQMYERKMAEGKEKNRALQNQLYEIGNKMQQVNGVYKQKIILLERNFSNRIIELEEQIRVLKNKQYTIISLQNDNKEHLQELRLKQQKIYALQEENRQLKSKQNDKASEYNELLKTKSGVVQQLNEVKRKLQQVMNEVKITNEVKNRYGNELQILKQRVRQLTQQSQDQSRHIKQIQIEHESKKKIQNDVSIISELTQTQNNQKADILEQANRQLEKLLMNEKIDKENKERKYRQIIQQYKQLNEDLSTELQMYRDATSIDHPLCPLLPDSRQRSLKERRESGSSQLRREKERFNTLIQKSEKIMEKNKGFDMKISQFDKIQKQAQFLQVENSSMRAQITQLNIRIQQYKGIIESMRRQADNRIYDANQLRYSIQREYQGKMEVQKMEIINQYNALLRNRGVRIEPSQLKSIHRHYEARYESQPPYKSNTNESFYSEHYNNTLIVPVDQKIRQHPDYKRLQQECIRIRRQLLQAEQSYNRNLIEYRDEIHKLKIQNQYHRKTIDELHAEGYGLTNEDGREGEEHYRNKYQELNRKYHKLYEEFIGMRNKTGQNPQMEVNFSFGDKIRDMLRPSTAHTSTHIQRSQLESLKKTIDEKLIQLQITPRDPASIIERAIWVIQKISALVIQLKKDKETLKNQKKQANKQNDKLKVDIETLEYEKNHLLKDLAVAIQRYRILEQRSLRMGTVSYASRLSDPLIHIEIPEIKFQQGKQKDVYNHQASKIRQQRFQIMRKYQAQLESLNLQQDSL